MNDIGIIHWPFVLTAHEAEVAGEIDLEALDACLDDADTALRKADETGVTQYVKDYLGDAWDALKHAQIIAADDRELAARVTDLADMILRWLEIDHWPPAVHLAVAKVAELRREVAG